MPEMIPVAQNINPPNPAQSLGNLSSIIGIRQQQQQLQQQQLQTQQAQGVQNFFKNWDPSDHLAPDGTTDLDSAMKDPSFVSAGNAKPAIMQALLDVKQKQLTAKQSLAALDDNLLGQYSRGVGALAEDPDVKADTKDPTTGVNAGRAKLDAFIGNFSKLSPEAGRVAQIYGPVTQHAPEGKLADAAYAMQLQGADVGTQRAQQNPAQVPIQTGAETQVFNVNRRTGIQPGQKPAQAIPNALGPTDQPDYKARVAAAQSRASGVAGTDIERSAQVSQSANAAPAAIQLSQSVDDLADQIHSGQISKGLSKAAAALGIDPISYARQVLNKDLGQLKTLASGNAATDAKMGTILSGYPDETSATPTIHTAMDYIRGSFRQSLARGQNLSTYRTKQPDLTGFQHADDVLTQSTTPLMHEYMALKTPAERTGFYQRNFTSPQEAAAFKARVNGVNHVLGQ